MPTDDPHLGFGPYTVHPAQGLRCGDREIRVTPKSLALLYALAERSGEVVTKAELLDIVWHGRPVTDAALSACIRELRKALGDDAREPSFIETVHRRGFRLLLAATRIHGTHSVTASLEPPVANVDVSTAGQRTYAG